MARNRRRSSQAKDSKRCDDRKMRRETRDEERQYSGDARNDIAWYSRNPNLLIAAGSFPYPYRPGMRLPLGSGVLPEDVDNKFNVGLKRALDIPGVMVLDWAPSVGWSERATDPASICAKEIYAKVRKVYSGSLEADAPDFVVYLMSLDSIYSYIAWLKRLYRILNVWTPENYALPDVVLDAMGLGTAEVLSLREHRTQLWQCINELVLQSRKFTCPAVMDIFNRHYWMSDNVYTDEQMINSQFYMFNLRALYQFAMLPIDSAGNTGPGLKMITMPTDITSTTNYVDVEKLYQFGRNLIDALVAWDEAYTINGYLMRAYEGVPSFMVDELPLDQPFTPVYEPEVLAQIENSRTIPQGDRITDFSGFNVTQDVPSNSIISKPQYTATIAKDSGHQMAYGGYLIPPVLSVRSQTPTVADSTIASRLQAAVEVLTSTSDSWTLKVHAGTEIPFAWRVVKSTSMGLGWTSAGVVYQTFNYVTTDAFIPIIALLNMEQFDWHPFVFYTQYNLQEVDSQTTLMSTDFAIVGDTHNITTITIEDLANLHKICIYSELNAFSA